MPTSPPLEDPARNGRLDVQVRCGESRCGTVLMLEDIQAGLSDVEAGFRRWLRPDDGRDITGLVQGELEALLLRSAKDMKSCRRAALLATWLAFRDPGLAMACRTAASQTGGAVLKVKFDRRRQLWVMAVRPAPACPAPAMIH